MEAHSSDNGTVGHGVRGLGGSDRIEGSQNADLAAVVHGRVTQGKDFKFQRPQYGRCDASGKASALPKSWVLCLQTRCRHPMSSRKRCSRLRLPTPRPRQPTCGMRGQSVGGRSNRLIAKPGSRFETLERSKNPIKQQKAQTADLQKFQK